MSIECNHLTRQVHLVRSLVTLVGHYAAVMSTICGIISLLAEVFSRAEAEQDKPALTALKPAKPEARSHRTPQTARPAKAGLFHEQRYQRPSAPYVDVEWEDSPSNGTKVCLCSTAVS